MKAISLLFFFLLGSCATNEAPMDPIQSKIMGKQEKIQQCYHESDSFGKKRAGHVVVEFVIDSAGKVQEEKIKESAFKDANFHSCLLEQIRKISFDLDPRERTSAEAGFNFTPVIDENI